MKQSQNRDIWISMGLSAVIAIAVLLTWLFGGKIILFIYSLYDSRSYPTTTFQFVFLLSVGFIAAYLAEKQLIGKYKWHIFAAICIWLLLLVYFARVHNYGVLFIPGMSIILLTAAVIHIKRLWQIDSGLTSKLEEIISSSRTLGGKSGDFRIESGLRLLETLLPNSEAVVFEFDSQNRLKPIGRRRIVQKTTAAQRQIEWRSGVELCEQALKNRESIVKVEEANPNAAKIALPLIHDEFLVGVLLVNIKDNYEFADKFLLESFSEQIARNFRRKEFLDKNLPNAWHSFLSSDLSRNRLELVSLFHSMLKEQRFGSLASSYLKEAHAIAYLDGTLAYINRQMQKMAGFKSGEIHDLDLFTLLSRFKSEVFNDPTIAVRKVLQTGGNFRCEIVFPEKKQTLSLRITLIKIPAENQSVHDSTVLTKPICFLITIRDISAIKENERLRSDMVSLMSHELRTPVTSIKGFSELLLMDEKISEESKEFLNIISNESQRLSKMLTTFLSVSNLEQADKQGIKKTPLKLDTVVHEVIADFKEKAKNKKIRLVEQASSHLPPIAADKGLIKRVLRNLIDNAIKYSPERTSVTISTILEADSLRVEVEDKGYGIPSEDIDKIWQKFYRVVRDGHDKEDESTGLGLTFVKEAIEHHGGDISVESEPGIGSKFTFRLPRL